MTANQQKTINQHYVPQSYLSAFANAKEQLAVFDKTNLRSFETNYRNVAAEREFNDFSGTLDPTDAASFQSIEKSLALIEDKGARLIRELTKFCEDRTAVSRSIWRNLCAWTALQLLRTKESREVYRQAQTELGNALMRDTAPDLTPDIEVDNLTLSYSEDYIKWRHLCYVFESSNDFANLLEGKILQIWFNTTRVPFWTSDHPV